MSDNNEITAIITTEEPAVAATLDELRYLVLHGKKGDTGDSAYDEAVKRGFEGTEAEWLASLKGEKGDTGEVGVSFVSAYLDDGVVRYVDGYGSHDADDIYTATAMAQDIDNGVLPLVHYSPEDNVFDYFELDRYDISGATWVVYFRSKDYLLSVDSTGAYTLTDRPQGGGSADAVLYTPQSLTDSQKAQARTNVGAGTYSKPSGGIPKTDLSQAVQDALDATSSGLTEEVKQALLDCFEHVAWIDDEGQDYYDALYAALYPPKTLVSISAAFNQGSAVIYDTDSLDTLKQYLTVTAIYDDTSTGVVTNYTLSGTLTVGTSTITVLYGGKTTTFDVTVTEGQGLPSAYQAVEYIEGTGTQFINTGIVPTDVFGFKIAFSSRDVRTDATYFGTKVGANMACYGGFYNGKPFLGWNSTVTDNGLITSVTAGNPTEVSLNYKNSRAVKQGNTSILQANKSPLATLTGDYSSVPFRLFGRNNIETPTVKAALFFSVEFTNGSDVVANMIPCYHKTSGVIGMYDIVRKRFFTNDGTGTFLKGGDVT